MHFEELHDRLIALLRQRILNGEFTERSLSRMVGVSQPHIHNVLKGHRILSPKFADSILDHLQLSVLDLLKEEELDNRLRRSPWREVPLLDGYLGPGASWPTLNPQGATTVLPSALVGAAVQPMLVRLAEDPAMPVLLGRSMALLDTSLPQRERVQSELLYAALTSNGSLVRHAKREGDNLVIFSEITNKYSDFPEVFPLRGRTAASVIRARVHLLPVGFSV